MRYVFCIDNGRLEHKDPTNTFWFDEKLMDVGHRVLDQPFCIMRDSFIDDATSLQDLEDKLEAIKNAIYEELEKLDLIVPRIIEDIIEFTDYQPYQSKVDVINRKQELRLQLKEL